MIVKTGTHYLDWNHWHWCLKKKWKLIYCLSSTLICTTSLSPLLTWAGTWYHYPTHCFYQGSCWRRDLVSDIYNILISSCPSMVSWNHCLINWKTTNHNPPLGLSNGEVLEIIYQKLIWSGKSGRVVVCSFCEVVLRILQEFTMARPAGVLQEHHDQEGLICVTLGLLHIIFWEAVRNLSGWTKLAIWETCKTQMFHFI